MRFGIIQSKFNEFITKKLLDGCLKELAKNEISEKNIDVIKVPGTFEIPTAAKNLIDLKKYSAIICLGCVIRGETTHYDHICNAVSNQLSYLGATTGLPIIFGIITCENTDQALDRAGGKKGNKGQEAAIAAIEMVSNLKQLQLSKTF